ncbi:MAG: hypothetical protein ACREDZ_08795 [Kiloniellales bacterium]
MSAIPLRTLAFGLSLALVVTAGSSGASAAMKLWSPAARDGGAITLDRQVHDKRFHGKRPYWQHHTHRKLLPYHKQWRQHTRRHRWQHHYRPLPRVPFAWQRHYNYHRPHFHGRPPFLKYWNLRRGGSHDRH